MEHKNGNLSEELLKDLDLIGDNHIMTSIETPMRDDAFELSDQEKAVLLLIAEGAANKAIAEELHLSQGTVRNYVSSILSKLHLANRVEAAAYAIKHRLNDHV